MKKYAAVLAAAALVTVGACSGDSSDTSGAEEPGPESPAATDTPEEAQAKANIKEGLLEQGGGMGGATLSDEQATCVADGLVDELGVDKLREYRLLTKNDRLRIENPTDLDPGDADAVASTFVDCVDVGQLVTAELGDLEGMGAQARQCIEDAIDEDALRTALSDTLQGRTPDLGGMQQDLAKCGPGALRGNGQ